MQISNPVCGQQMLVLASGKSESHSWYVHSVATHRQGRAEISFTLGLEVEIVVVEGDSG